MGLMGAGLMVGKVELDCGFIHEDGPDDWVTDAAHARLDALVTEGRVPPVTRPVLQATVAQLIRDSGSLPAQLAERFLSALAQRQGHASFADGGRHSGQRVDAVALAHQANAMMGAAAASGFPLSAADAVRQALMGEEGRKRDVQAVARRAVEIQAEDPRVNAAEAVRRAQGR